MWFWCVADSTVEEKDDLREFTAVLDKYQSFAVSPAVTVGLDYQGQMDIGGVYFTTTSALTRDMVQSHYRCRQIREKLLYFFSNDSAAGRPHVSGSCSRASLRKILAQRSQFDKVVLKYSWLRTLWVHTEQEANVDTFCHAAVVRAYLRACNYTIETLTLTECEDETDMEAIYEALKSLEIADYEYTAYRSLDRYEVSQMIQQPETLSKEEKVEVRKFMFDMSIVPKNAEVTLDERRVAFAAYMRSPDEFERRQRFLLYEYDLEQGDPINGYLDNPRERAEQIHQLAGLLGLSEGTQQLGQVVEREALQQVMEGYSTAERNRLIKLFNSRPSRNKVDSASTSESADACQQQQVARAAEFVNKILYAHGYTCIAQQEKEKRLRKGGVQLNVTPFVVNLKVDKNKTRKEAHLNLWSILHRGFLAYMENMVKRLQQQAESWDEADSFEPIVECAFIRDEQSAVAVFS